MMILQIINRLCGELLIIQAKTNQFGLILSWVLGKGIQTDYLTVKLQFKFMEQAIIKDFGNKVRVRVCGVLMEESKTLLLKHTGLGEKGFLWLPPGGGVDFGETVTEALKREFLEETNLAVGVGSFLKFREFVSPPLHAIELYFLVSRINGNIRLGTDPDSSKKIIVEMKWFSKSEILQIPSECLASDLKDLILELLTKVE